MQTATKFSAFFTRPDEVTVHDAWTVSRLCGAGSHDVEVADVFVPEHAHA